VTLAGSRSGDTSVFERTSASDVLVLPPDGSLIAGRQAHVNSERTFFNAFTSVIDNKSEEIVVSGDWGFDRETYRFTETPRAGGATVVRQGNYLWLARREPDGVWRYARIIWNTREPPPEYHDDLR
jgi:ketosteroid isomerase-like protein